MFTSRSIAVVVACVLSCTQAYAQAPIARFSSTDLRANEYVGYSLATDGQHILIGTGAGSAFLYDPNALKQLAKITLPDPRYSTSVAIDGATAVIGSRVGAYVYDISDPNNITQTRLQPNDGPHSMFGVSVDISGDTIIVGANGDDYAGSFTGSAFLFDRVTGNQFAKLIADDGKEYDNYGISVAIDGDRAVVGSVSAGVEPFGDGAVYLYDASPGITGNRQLDKYTATPQEGSSSSARFGYNTDIHGDHIVALQTGWQSYLWQVGGQPAALPDSSENRVANDSLCIYESLAAVGYPRKNYVTVYDTNRSVYGYLASPEPGQTGFGASVAIAGDYIVVGSPGASGGGAAYIYYLSDILGGASPPGDLDGDGFVGLSDLDIVLGSWNQTVPPGDHRGDAIGIDDTGPDGYIGIDDLDFVLSRWNIGAPPIYAMNVPGPGSLFIAVVSAGGLFVLRGGRRD